MIFLGVSRLLSSSPKSTLWTLWYRHVWVGHTDYWDGSSTPLHLLLEHFPNSLFAPDVNSLQCCRAKRRWRAGSGFPLKRQSNELSLCECFASFLIDPTEELTSCFFFLIECPRMSLTRRKNAKIWPKKLISILRLWSWCGVDLDNVNAQWPLCHTCCVR